MERIVRNLPPEAGYAGRCESEGGPLIEPAPSRPGVRNEGTRAYRDPDDLFGIWTHCETRTTLRTLSRQ